MYCSTVPCGAPPPLSRESVDSLTSHAIFWIRFLLMNEWLQIAKNVNKVFGPRLSHYRIESNGKNSIVNIEDTGLSLLLGRNGSGKTQLIEAIKNWSTSTENPVRAFPVFRLPTSTDISDWRNYVDQLQEMHFVKQEIRQILAMPDEDVDEATVNYSWVMDQTLRGASIPMLESLSQSIEYSKQMVHAELGNMNNEEVLHYFNFSESAIKNWQWRKSQANEWRDDPQPFIWLENTNIRSYACDYFLQHLATAPKITKTMHSLDSENNVSPGWGRWFDDQSLASLIGPATEEFFDCMSLVELESSTSFRLISRPKEDGDFAVFEHEIQNFIKSAQGEFPNERYPRQFEDFTQVFFPGKLFIPSNDPNERATPLLHTKKQEIESLPYIVDVTPLQDIGAFVQRVKKNIYRLVKVEPKAESRDSFTVQLTGLEKLDQISDSVSRLLESIELSISAVRISPVKINPMSGLNSYWPQMEKPLPTEPVRFFQYSP